MRCLIVEKLTDEKRDIIFTRLCAGISIRDISDELQVSEKTVKRYKKSMLQALEARDNVPDDKPSLLQHLHKVKAPFEFFQQTDFLF